MPGRTGRTGPDRPGPAMYASGVATRTPSRATYAQIEALPPNRVGEILHGELVVSPRPAPAHAVAASVLGARINTGFQLGDGGPGGWWILDEPELHLGEDVLVPDLAGWRRSRMPALPETPWFGLAPDWTCEVLSPSTARIDRSQKMEIYARERVPHHWNVDPATQTHEVYERSEQGRWLLLGVHAGSAKVRAVPFDALELDLSALWA